MISKMKRGNKLITASEACDRANIFADLEKRSIYVCSNPPTLISFEAPKASITVVKRN